MRFAAMQSVFGLSGDDLFAAAEAAGFVGVELVVGDPKEDPALDAAGQRQFCAAASRTGLAIPSICLSVLNRFGFKDSDPDVRAMTTDVIRRAIEACCGLGARVILVPFFGRSRLESPEDEKRVAEGLARVAPVAEAASVTLAVEDTLTADRNLALLDQVGSHAVQVYYDVANPAYYHLPWMDRMVDDLRRLDEHIAQIHIKDSDGLRSEAMLGEGTVDLAGAAQALRELAYDRWLVLETCTRSNALADAQANLAYCRRVFA